VVRKCTKWQAEKGGYLPSLPSALCLARYASGKWAECAQVSLQSVRLSSRREARKAASAKRLRRSRPSGVLASSFCWIQKFRYFQSISQPDLKGQIRWNSSWLSSSRAHAAHADDREHRHLARGLRAQHRQLTALQLAHAARYIVKIKYDDTIRHIVLRSDEGLGFELTRRKGEIFIYKK